MSGLAIRAATERDIEPLTRLIAAFRDHLRQAGPESSSIPAALARLMHDPGTQFLLALGPKQAPLGYSQLRFRYSMWVAGLEAQLDDLFVLPMARRRGVGRQLLAASVETARARGARVVGLNTNERNQEALRLYAAAGFSAQRGRWGGGLQLWLELAI